MKPVNKQKPTWTFAPLAICLTLFGASVAALWVEKAHFPSTPEQKVSRLAAEVCEEVRRVLANYEPGTETLDRYQAKNIVNRCYNLYSND